MLAQVSVELEDKQRKKYAYPWKANMTHRLIVKVAPGPPFGPVDCSAIENRPRKLSVGSLITKYSKQQSFFVSLENTTRTP